MKFTKEIKDNWLKALKSGEYTQGYRMLVTPCRTRHCCIGVLGEVTEGLSNNGDGKNPYEFLEDTIEIELGGDLWRLNDKNYSLPNDPRDYANVIPFIENLKTT